MQTTEELHNKKANKAKRAKINDSLKIKVTNLMLPDNFEELVRQRAYELHTQNPTATPEQNWFQAEMDIKKAFTTNK
jgi:hypothetical protein